MRAFIRMGLALGLAGGALACGQPRTGFPSMDASVETGAGDAPGVFLEGSTGGPPLGCEKLACQEVRCPVGKGTVLHGTVLAPTVITPDPLYNAIVYIPNGPVAPFSPGVSCDHCGAPVSGSPVALALSAPDGTFSIPNPPAGDDIPLVIQLGRWRRQVTIPHIEACATTEVPGTLTHLPRSQSEGDIPQMAIATGLLDPMECLLRKIGIDDAEFTGPTGPGRVHFYVQNGMDLSPPAPAADTLWSDVATLDRYDIVLFPCEGAPNVKPAAATQNIVDYTSAGGRLFTTHYSYSWIYGAPAPFPSTADWQPNQEPFPPDPLPGFVDTTFPKGAAMAAWLTAVHATTTPGEVAITEPRQDVNAVRAPPSQGWINSLSPITAQHFTFDTPIGVDDAAQCGKVVFSDFHVASNETTGTAFPADCVAGALTPQEKILEFMLFDLSSCVQDDAKPPTPPPLK